MTRCVDADVVIENIDEWLETVGTAVIGKGLSYYYELLGCVEEAPTIHTAPVVRCKDCRWANINLFAKELGIVYCNNYGKRKKQDDFCSEGERRDGERLWTS